MGGDGTFLKTASMIKTKNLPIVGVNTDPARSIGHLTSIPIPYLERNKEVPRFIEFMNQQNFKFEYKSRIKVSCKSQVSDNVRSSFALNEVFVAEK